MSKLIGIGTTAKALGVSMSTLQRWDESGTLKAKRTLQGHRRYDLAEIAPELLHKEPNHERKTIAYAP